jgi:hypothetical protein
MNIKIKKNENTVEMRSLEQSLLQEKREYKKLTRIQLIENIYNQYKYKIRNITPSYNLEKNQTVKLLAFKNQQSEK